MKCKYIILNKSLPLPGIGSNNRKISANGLDGSYVAMVKSITRDDHGYVLELSAGPHKGRYHIPFHNVELAFIVDDAPAITAVHAKVQRKRAA